MGVVLIFREASTVSTQRFVTANSVAESHHLICSELPNLALMIAMAKLSAGLATNRVFSDKR